MVRRKETLDEWPGPLLLRDWDCEARAAWEAGRGGPSEGMDRAERGGASCNSAASAQPG